RRRDRRAAATRGRSAERGGGPAPNTQHQAPSTRTAVSLTASDLGVPETFNATTHFVHRNADEGRGENVAIECLDDRITYDDVLRHVNRCGNALRDALGVR